VVETVTKKGDDDDDLKNFYIKVAMHKDSLKAVSHYCSLIS